MALRGLVLASLCRRQVGQAQEQLAGMSHVPRADFGFTGGSWRIIARRDDRAVSRAVERACLDLLRQALQSPLLHPVDVLGDHDVRLAFQSDPCQLVLGPEQIELPLGDCQLEFFRPPRVDHVLQQPELVPGDSGLRFGLRRGQTNLQEFLLDGLCYTNLRESRSRPDEWKPLRMDCGGGILRRFCGLDRKGT